MFDEYTYRLNQMRQTKLVMDDVLSFRPDDKIPDDVQDIIDAAELGLSNAQTSQAEMNLARGEREEKLEPAHDAVVKIHPIMKERFRKDKGSLSAINRLPVEDNTPDKTRLRMKSMSKLWAKLPNPPGSATPFKAWDTMGRTEFDLLFTALDTAMTAEITAEEDWDIVMGRLRDLQEEMEDFIGAALVQGRNQFAEGTPERAAVDGIETEGGTPPPAKAAITDEQANEPGKAWIEYEASHATTFDVFRKGEADPDFVLVANHTASTTYEATGLPAGTYTFKVAGRNSRGTGPESDPVSLAVV